MDPAETAVECPFRRSLPGTRFSGVRFIWTFADRVRTGPGPLRRQRGPGPVSLSVLGYTDTVRTWSFRLRGYRGSPDRRFPAGWLRCEEGKVFFFFI